MANPAARTALGSAPEAAQSALRRAGIVPAVRSVARWALAASITGSGCSSAFDHEDFVPTQCAMGIWQPLVGLSPAEAHEHVALIDYGFGLDGTTYDRQLLAQTGESCTGATDAAACAAELDTAWRTTNGPAILSTDGGTLSRWDGPHGIVRFLGDVDTPQEATLLVWSYGYDLRCNDIERSAVRPLADGGHTVIAIRAAMRCGDITRSLIRVGVDGALDVREHESFENDGESGFYCAGRRPVGLVRSRGAHGKSPLGAYLARIARLEASAVVAFDVLHRELAALSAPRALLGAIRDAGADEVRHARIISRLARARGGRARPPCVVESPLRSALDLALDNAVEGCVRETYGAAVGLYQAARAADPELRAAMIDIAEDELRHADLSWRIDSFLATRLDDDQRAAVRRARRSATRDLAREARAPVDPVLAHAAGLPPPAVSIAMVGAWTCSNRPNATVSQPSRRRGKRGRGSLSRSAR